MLSFRSDLLKFVYSSLFSISSCLKGLECNMNERDYNTNLLTNRKGFDSKRLSSN